MERPLDGTYSRASTPGDMFYTAGQIILRTFYFANILFLDILFLDILFLDILFLWTFYFMGMSFYEHFFHDYHGSRDESKGEGRARYLREGG